MHRVANTFYKDKDQENIELHLVVPRGLKIATNLYFEVIGIVGCHRKSPKIVGRRQNWMDVSISGIYWSVCCQIPGDPPKSLEDARNSWTLLNLIFIGQIWYRSVLTILSSKNYAGDGFVLRVVRNEKENIWKERVWYGRKWII